jgi:hypothetical protein
MKLRFLCLLIFLSFFFVACGDGGSDSINDSGTVSMSVTDAKPLLPESVSNFYVEFSKIWVHKSGGKWAELPLVESPHTIDLLQFQNGSTTELVPPTILSSGKYTQVRFEVSNAILKFENGDEYIVQIPSGNLKTDKNFTIDVESGTAIDLVIHFDLSRSLVVSGDESDPVYKLKPVLHLFDNPISAASISGTINNESFGGSGKATITVFSETDQEQKIFTQVEVTESEDSDTTAFDIFWIVPSQIYTVQIDFGQDDVINCEEFIEDIHLAEGEMFLLNGGDDILLDAGICE